MTAASKTRSDAQLKERGGRRHEIRLEEREYAMLLQAQKRWGYPTIAATIKAAIRSYCA